MVSALKCRAKQGEPLAFLLGTALNYRGDECLTWPYANGAGYGLVSIDGKLRLVNHIICEHRHGPPPTPKHEVAHSCGRGHLSCCAGNHMSWKTRKENHADKLAHGTHNRGERHNLVKLTEANVQEIRSLRGHVTGRSLARRFNVTPTTICDIQRRRAWSWLEEIA